MKTSPLKRPTTSLAKSYRSPLKTDSEQNDESVKVFKQIYFCKQRLYEAPYCTYRDRNGLSLSRKLTLKRKYLEGDETKPIFEIYNEYTMFELQKHIILEQYGEIHDFSEPIACVLDDRVRCKTCNRFFNYDSAKIHIAICKRVFFSRVSPFKARKYLTSGKKAAKPRTMSKVSEYISSRGGGLNLKLNDNWRLQRAVLHAAISQAKKGKKQSDGTLDDRVTCFKCLRRFKSFIALRHIPVCYRK